MSSSLVYWERTWGLDGDCLKHFLSSAQLLWKPLEYHELDTFLLPTYQVIQVAVLAKANLSNNTDSTQVKQINSKNVQYKTVSQKYK